MPADIEHRAPALQGRAAGLVRMLDLVPHVEGGFFREIWRSKDVVAPADRRGKRAALTSIYFLLPRGAVSRWHRVRSDELWHHCEGDPLELWLMSPEQPSLSKLALGALAHDREPVRAVPAGWWQAATPLGEYTLVSCSVAPGFDFSDFELLAEQPASDALQRARDDASELL